MELAPVTSSVSTRKNPAQRFTFTSTDASVVDTASPGVDGLDKLAEEARACSEVNYVGTVLALGAFVSPALSLRLSLCVRYHADVLGTTIGFLVSLSSTAPSVFSSCYDCCALSSYILCNQGRRSYGYGEL